VEDASLTDQAIFDRLERDIRFRSLATRLVQRYGYLLPTFNPDSDLGKQQDFLLKERARHQLQREAKEDAEMEAAARKQLAAETAEGCESGDQACPEPSPRKASKPSGASGTRQELAVGLVHKSGTRVIIAVHHGSLR
jgi:hypothetical protein